MSAAVATGDTATPEETSILDDIDARPGSTASILRTIIGLTLRRLGGWISTSDLVRLASDAGIEQARARTAIARVKQHGLLLASREGGSVGYRLNPAATAMLERGDRRIFTVRQMQPDDAWCLISFSLPEARRDTRHQLRRRLQWIGCGVVSPALWICPAHLQDEVDEIFRELGIRDAAVLFRTATPQVAGSLADAVATWWDLDTLRGEHERFQYALTGLAAAEGAEVFSAYVRLIDSWRVLPYIDPGLPAELLPADWPGQHSFDEFRRLSVRFAQPAWEHVRATVSADDVSS
ncbi:MAG TPA: regulator [Microbacterium sp.]|uniref:PaaX family transcriptional regulator n=1 Tax=Microbacterium sp. TaxID=51671 RepID=UPI000EC80444|nr:regulator [Microbacterium sp.]